MNQILSENLNKTLAEKEFIYDFEIKEQGLYGIEITASAKSRRQNLLSLRSFLRDSEKAKRLKNPKEFQLLIVPNGREILETTQRKCFWLDYFSERQEINHKKQCYEIAKNIISGQTENPTTATHFHGVGVSMDWFLKNIVPNGEFLRKIGDTYFYSSPN
ncbi:cell wall hydrolase [Candidatus Parcubacteria bacterium]|nr:cell wall hydrolase [Candidatus Parcubacteria bacterium]